MAKVCVIICVVCLWPRLHHQNNHGNGFGFNTKMIWSKTRQYIVTKAAKCGNSSEKLPVFSG